MRAYFSVAVIAVLLLLTAPSLAHADGLQSAIDGAYHKNRSLTSGKKADYIPALAKANAEDFAISIATSDGRVAEIGDVHVLFPIESISKVFTLAQAIEDRGITEIVEKIGANATGLPFNSALAVEINREGKAGMNPLVNAGAIATVSLVKGSNGKERYARLLENISAYAGRTLALNQEVYASEAATNQHNRALAALLFSYGRLYSDAKEATDIYTKLCSLNVTTHDLAVMGAVLANGGIHPFTGKRLLHAESVAHVLAIMATAGMYEVSGEWLVWTGMPAKSGVSGGILAIRPGKMAIASFSPLLDASGNSVRGQAAIKDIVNSLQLHVFHAESKAR